MEPQRSGKIKDGIVDDFSEAASWLAVASGQAELKLTSEPGTNGTALRLDFDFKGGGGFVGARKVFALRLPEAYAFSFRVRGVAPKNKLEFKLVDPWRQECLALAGGRVRFSTRVPHALSQEQRD